MLATFVVVMPWCACANEVYGSLCVCVCLSVCYRYICSAGEIQVLVYMCLYVYNVIFSWN